MGIKQTNTKSKNKNKTKGEEVESIEQKFHGLVSLHFKLTQYCQQKYHNTNTRTYTHKVLIH